MSSLPPTASLQHIQYEVVYMRGLIGALDETSDSYAERKMELEMEIRDLEQRYKKSQTEQGRNQNDDDDDDEVMRIINGTSGGRVTGTLDGLAEHTTSALNGAESSAMDFHGFAGNESNVFAELDAGSSGDFWNDSTTGINDWSFADLDNPYPTRTTTGAQAVGESLSSVSSPQQTSAESSPSFAQLPSRKRPRGSLAVNNSIIGQPEAKSMRATPSPAMTAPTTPSSLDSFDLPDDPEFVRLTGGNPKGDMEDFKQNQKEIMSMIEQDRRSAELAKKLTEEEYSPPQRLPQPSSQAMLDFNGRSFRPMDPPPARTFPATSSTSSNGIQTKQISQPARVDQPLYIKEEWRPKASGKTLPKVIPAGFIDLGSDSSDLEEIEPKDFIDSGRKSRPQADVSWVGNGLNYTSMPPSNGFARKDSWADVEQLDASTSRSDLLQDIQDPSSVFAPNILHPAFTGFGGTNVYSVGSSAAQPQPSWYLDAAGMIGQGFASAAQGVKNAAYSFLDEHINTYPGALTGYGGVGLPGSSTNPQVVGSSPDINYYGYPQQPSFQSGMATNPALFPNFKGPELNQNYWDRYDYLTNDPTRTREEIKSLLENIRPDEDLPENREGDPEAMKYPLMPHQKLGLTWMKNMEEGSNKGGILADDMGLGKTIQALALMVSRKSPDPTRKTNLIVAPVALMKQWEREIQKKLKSGHHALTTYILHGAKRDTTFADLKRYDVVLTTFGTLANELKRKEGIDMKKRVNPNWQPSGKADRLPLLGDECKWYR